MMIDTFFTMSGSSPGTGVRQFPARALVVLNSNLPKILRRTVPKQQVPKSDPLYQLAVRKGTLPGALHPDVGKVIRHKGRSVVVLSVHSEIRQVQSQGDTYSFWIPRRPIDRKRFKIEQSKRRSRGKTRFPIPSWSGESRPDGLHVPLSAVSRTLTPEEITTLLGLELEKTALYAPSLFPRPEQCPPHRKSRQELGEVVTATDLNEPERRDQLEAHNNLTAYLRAAARMSDSMRAGIYDILILGEKLKDVAEKRGLNRRSLSVTVSVARTELATISV